MAEQLTFDLPMRAALGREDFFVSPANAGAVALIDGWRDWPMSKAILVGETGSGKTHLAHVFAAQSDALILDALDIQNEPFEMLSSASGVVVENADKVAGRKDLEELLFHLHNALTARSAPLLLTSRSTPSRWGLDLPDLASRMAQATLTRLEMPDDQLLIAVMLKRATDRQLPLTPAMLSYLSPRLPRSFAAADDVIARIDAIALSEKKRPTQTHVRLALDEVTSNLPPSS